MTIQPPEISPHYPRYVESDLIVKRRVSGVGFVYSAKLTDGFHNTVCTGPECKTEQEAILALGQALAQKAEVLRLRAEKLVK